MNKKLQTGLVAIFLCLLVLFTSPIITIPEGQIFSMPALLFYLMVVWVGLIILMGLIFLSNKPKQTKKDIDT